MSFHLIEVYEVACDHDDCPEIHDAKENHYEPALAVIEALADAWQETSDLHFCPDHRTDLRPAQSMTARLERAA